MTPVAADTTVAATDMAIATDMAVRSGSSPCREMGATNDPGAGGDSATSPVNTGTSSMQTA
eukprot:36817-Eustigmatos_ZCMA.PRE.1